MVDPRETIAGERGAVEELKYLKQRRRTIKSQLTHFKSFLNKCKQEVADSERLEIRLERIKEVYEPFDSIQSGIERLDETTEHEIERLEIEDNYMDLIVEAKKLLKSFKDAERQGQLEEDNRSQTSNEAVDQGDHRDTDRRNHYENDTRSRRKIKLPEATLPTFDGRYEDWLSFKDTFTSMIHSQSDLNNIEKLQYLKAAVKGDAARKIKSFTITETNYTAAWKLLENAYSDKSILISRHINMILQLPVQEKESADGLNRLADETQQHMHSLAALGVPSSEEFVVQILQNKLHHVTHEKWRESVEKGVFPKLDDMMQFLYRRAAHITQRNSNQFIASRSTKSDQQSGATKQTKRVTKQTFVTATASTCILCKDKQHPLYRCDAFRKLSVPKRLEVVKEASLCTVCLRGNHGPKDCKLGNCVLCNQRHNSLLHAIDNQQPSGSRA